MTKTPEFWGCAGAGVQSLGESARVSAGLYWPSMKRRLITVLLACLASCLASCAATDVNRSLCEGFQARARVVDPLADPKPGQDRVTCEAYEAERARVRKEKAD